MGGVDAQFDNSDLWYARCIEELWTFMDYFNSLVVGQISLAKILFFEVVLVVFKARHAHMHCGPSILVCIDCKVVVVLGGSCIKSSIEFVEVFIPIAVVDESCCSCLSMPIELFYCLLHGVNV